MSTRYFAQVVQVQDKLTVIVNAGENKGVKTGQKFLIVGLGQEVYDPDTKESLGALEIVRGKAEVIHVQEKMATLKSIDWLRNPDIREITKVRKTLDSASMVSAFSRVLGNIPNETITESIKPQEPSLKPLNGVDVGDKVIAL